MRIPIAVQLGLLVLLTTLSGIAILAIATWFTTYEFVVEVGSQGLELVASIKASQIASTLEVLEVTCKTISTRILIQAALKRNINGNTTSGNWDDSLLDFQSALGSRGYLSLYQVMLYSRDGKQGSSRLLNVTSDSLPKITLPWTAENGSAVQLGSTVFPPSLYPNITYSESSTKGGTSSPAAYAFPDYPLNLHTALLLGPLWVNDSFSLVSLTLPIVNNTSDTELLGFMTVLASAASIQDVVASRDGLGKTGQVLLIGPARPQNRFAKDAQPATPSTAPDSAALADSQVHYVFEPTPLPGQQTRHSKLTTSDSFSLSSYKAALEAMNRPYAYENKSLSRLTTTNEEGNSVAVGIIRPQTNLTQWILVVEETHSEAFSPVYRLRKIILACFFGTAGAILLLVPLLAHFAVAPIRRLREAARRSVILQMPSPPSSRQAPQRLNSADSDPEGLEGKIDEKTGPVAWIKAIRRPAKRLSSANTVAGDPARRPFQIPARVKERRHCVRDELTELTSTFNEMSDELSIQYNRLEERVAERTRELEKAKLAAETANESKTLFIANISHELKTPLNGILGMCAVCMGEDNLGRVKKSLQVVYQSGDLLLHLLNDLLTFSKNQIEQAIQLEEKEFRLSDVRAQLTTIFQNQVSEKKINFSVDCFAGNEVQTGPLSQLSPDHDLGRPRSSFDTTNPTKLMDMVLWGDQHRILQVLINLVSNSLKFTPERGTVEVRIRCLGEQHGPLEEIDFSVGSRSGNPQMLLDTTPIRKNVSEKLQAVERSSEDHISMIARLPQLVFQFEVEDNGPGIPAHLHRRVFDPFVQGDLGLNRKYGGTGLGLSICAQLSRIMGGLILLDSQEGRGSQFTLRIPLRFVKEVAPSTLAPSTPGSRTPSVLSLEEFSNAARTPSNHSVRNETVAPGFEKSEVQPRLVGLSQPFFTPTVPANSPASPPNANGDLDVQEDGTKKIRVLVAEDNKVNQEVVRRMLALEEVYDVTMVKDGQEAFDTVKANMDKGTVFDLIFMDIQMPNLDGLQSTRLIREIGYSAPIVALSAFAEESNIKDCIDSGMDMFMSKPLRRPVLKQVLHKFATIPEESESNAS
ncbi:Two-component system protein B [Penicillium diatomitis]|uniref:histidine kinase n=1 Tax=Penicillium diatomitis TaxID=2819901 RepID=A0A9X0BUS1_9EURO|nr:Two-component system protein B [Penicillium diatomitis]KAJ5485503.1 Two-component system protein B [Penicillium diatomitis]